MRRLVEIHVDHTAVIHLDEILPVVTPPLRESRNAEIGTRSLFAQGSVSLSVALAGLDECHHRGSETETQPEGRPGSSRRAHAAPRVEGGGHRRRRPEAAPEAREERGRRVARALLGVGPAQEVEEAAEAAHAQDDGEALAEALQRRRGGLPRLLHPDVDPLLLVEDVVQVAVDRPTGQNGGLDVAGLVGENQLVSVG